jgi:predicted O-methyltransferase YrrM
MTLEDIGTIEAIKRHYAPDGGAEREHNATAATLGFGAIHYALVTNTRPVRALVIGSRYGYVPAIIALGMNTNGSGTVDLVDANYSDAEHGFEAAYGGIANWSGDARDRFAPLELNARVQVHVMRSSAFFDQCAERYQYVYIDGDHSYEGARYDLERATGLADAGTYILMHDALVSEPGFGIRQLVAELDCAAYGCTIINAWPGLAILQVRK